LLCSKGSVDVYVYVLRGDQVVLSEVPSLVIQRGMRSLLFPSTASRPDSVLASFRLSVYPPDSRPSVEGTFESLERSRADQKGKASALERKMPFLVCVCAFSDKLIGIFPPSPPRPLPHFV